MHWIDPDCLKPRHGHVRCFLFNPKGDADGLILVDGLEAHFPPHLSRDILKSIQIGEAVTLFGVKPRAAEMIACVALESVSGERIVDTGPPVKAKKKLPGKHAESTAESVDMEDVVERSLHGPKGEVRGVLLSNGCIVRFPPHCAEGAERLLKSGATLAVRGDVIDVPGSRVLEATAWGKSMSTLKPLPRKPHA
jgi:hypothetical protein